MPNGIKTIMEKPFRYGGIMHNYHRDIEGWQKVDGAGHFDRCYGCGKVMRNTRERGIFLKRAYPYMATFIYQQGSKKGKKHFEIICRKCAYNYGIGVIEADGNTYKNPYEFKESEYKKNLKECANCQYYEHEDIDDGYVCVCADSEYVTEWRAPYETCGSFAEKKKRREKSNGKRKG